LDERHQRVVANPFIFLPFSAGAFLIFHPVTQNINRSYKIRTPYLSRATGASIHFSTNSAIQLTLNSLCSSHTKRSRSSSSGSCRLSNSLSSPLTPCQRTHSRLHRGRRAKGARRSRRSAPSRISRCSCR
jgi:hypothetical protein